MRLSVNGIQTRAKKDEKPNTAASVYRHWREVTIEFSEEDSTVGLISGHWLYFEYEAQWYKVNTFLAEKDLSKESVYQLEEMFLIPQTPEERAAKRRARRQKRRDAKRAAEALAEQAQNADPSTDAF